MSHYVTSMALEHQNEAMVSYVSILGHPWDLSTTSLK